MGEPLADAVRDGSFERVVMENILVDESCELRLPARDVLRFNADARPDRIDFIEGPYGPRLKLSHTQDLPTPLGPLHRSFITFSKAQRERGRHPAHGSFALVKEVNNAGLVDLVAHGQHVVSVRDIDGTGAWNERGQFMAISGDLILRSDSDQHRQMD